MFDNVDSNNVCAAGTYKTEDGCLDCQIGKFSSITDQTQCMDCPAGYEGKNVAQSSCKACPVTFYTDLIGAASCKRCATGKTSNVGATSCFDNGGQNGGYTNSPSAASSSEGWLFDTSSGCTTAETKTSKCEFSY